MKKTYIQPATFMVKVALQQMIANSFDPTNGSGGGSKGVYSSGQLSRGNNSDWDDEE